MRSVATFPDLHPQPTSRTERFNPAFWATFRPGCAAVPLADAVIAATSRSSITTTRCFFDG